MRSVARALVTGALLSGVARSSATARPEYAIDTTAIDALQAFAEIDHPDPHLRRAR